MILKVSAIPDSVLDHGTARVHHNSWQPHETLSQIIDVKPKVKLFPFQNSEVFHRMAKKCVYVCQQSLWIRRSYLVLTSLCRWDSSAGEDNDIQRGQSLYLSSSARDSCGAGVSYRCQGSDNRISLQTSGNHCLWRAKMVSVAFKQAYIIRMGLRSWVRLQQCVCVGEQMDDNVIDIVNKTLSTKR